MINYLLPLHRKKKVREFPVPSRDVTTKLSLGRNNDVITELFLSRGSLVSDIPAGDGKLVNFSLLFIYLRHDMSMTLLTFKKKGRTVRLMLTTLDLWEGRGRRHECFLY
jgi:hypothetical protein